MRRAATLLTLALMASGRLSAQTGYPLRLYFQELETTADSVYLATAGGTFDFTVSGYNYLSNGLGSLTLRIWYDPALLSFVSARSLCPDSATHPLTSTTGSNYVELSAGGCQGGYYFGLARVRLQLAGNATTGTGFYLEPRAITDGSQTNRTDDATGDFDEVCLAVGIWGDVDNDGQVTSRDALIALSNAVGLPTTGFLVSRGDVDGDGYVGSRDALGMLSYAIGYPPAYPFRTARGIAAACAAQPVLPRALYFVRQGADPGIAGISGLVVRAANDSAQTIVGDSADAYPYYHGQPRVSPDGSKVAFVCYWTNPYGYQYPNICRANADGSGLINLTGGGYDTDESPTWSPTGDSIAFVRNNQIWVMASVDGSGKHVIPSSPSVVAVAWAPIVGSSTRRIAYTTYPGDVRTRDLDSAGTTDSLVSSGTSYAYDPQAVDWSPAGDSLVFTLYANGYYDGTYVVSRAGGTASRIARLQGAYGGSQTLPAWTDQGIFFNVYQYYPGPSRQRLFLLRSNGTMVRIGREGTGYFGAGMKKQ